MKLKLMTALCVSVLAASSVYADVDISPAAAQSASQDQHRQAGEAFLKKNKANPGVVTLADGLQYKVLTAGKGAKPTEQDVVTVEYAGKLIDGTEFDSSAKHGGTIDFQLGQVIPGWVEALKMMQPGSTWEIYIPSDLAYGETGAPPAIGPNETLIFKVKLVSFKKAA